MPTLIERLEAATGPVIVRNWSAFDLPSRPPPKLVEIGYMPHQGKQECARRAAALKARGIE